tara:strand:- start:1560 stop:3239 length:1680 start_codon:yes stop_codon:yes gene_type:complete
MKKLLYILLFVPFAFFGQVDDPCYSVNDYDLLIASNNPQIEINLVSGWNMIGYPCSQVVIVSDAFSSIVDKITIVKDNNGNVYMPEFGFNGIGLLEGGQGYQIKMNDFVLGFTFCQSIQLPNLEGCTDCEASNFNRWANVDDGSCFYDSDGDGVPDSLEVVGCQDVTGCNYNITATDSGECSYAQEWYDCEGNINVGIGDEAFGGMVYYIDESNEFGLVAAMEDLQAPNWEGVHFWGCYGEEILGADGESIGTGYQNTLSIAAACSWTTTAASGTLAYESEGYSDWFLPSFSELTEMYYSIGNGGSEGNLGGFDISGSDWSYYLSSTKEDSTNIWLLSFNNGYSYWGTTLSSFKVRPIRAFGNWTMGCMDVTACNFNPDANMADGTCEYPESGFYCDGSQVQIGDYYRGGIVFYIDDSNHGLISLDHDIGEYSWGCCCGYTISGADGMEIGDGYDNTIDIHNQCSGNAASACLYHEYEGFDDWYLPSRDELLEMMYVISESSTLGNIGNFSSQSFYWSSSEETINAAYNVWFDPNYDQPIGAYGGGKGNLNKVRPIRSF